LLTRMKKQRNNIGRSFNELADNDTRGYNTDSIENRGMQRQ